MKRYLFFALISYGFINAQQGEPFRMGSFGDFSAYLGYDLSNLIRDDEKTFDDDGNFSYGFSAQMGYQPWQSFAFSGGLRYTFVEPKNHLVQVFVQPYWILNKPEKGDDLSYISLKLGKQINKTAVPKSEFIGLSIGRYDFIKKKMGHKYEIGLDWHNLNGNGYFFVGASYGIYFSGK